MKTRKRIKIFLCAVILSTSLAVMAQDSADVFQVRVHELSDAQVRQLLDRANEAGYSEQDIYVFAQARGVAESEIIALQERIDQLNRKKDPVASKKKKKAPQVDKPPVVLPEPEPVVYFGYDLFRRNSGVSFESNLQIPTPEDYVIGPNDELIVNIYGQSERNYQVTVNTSGYVLLRNLGPVSVSGLSIEQAERKIRRSLGVIYTDLVSDNPSTFLQISIGKVRTIAVNLIGELKTPGTYTLNGLSTVFNAIYAAGGPTLNGTLREIRVFRGEKLLTTLDYYDFLLNGVTTANIRLRNDDMILVGPHLNRVSIKGEVKRPGVYEMKDEETFADLLKYAGGFSAMAYKDRISVTRNTGKERLVSDIFGEQFQLFEAKAGDEYEVGRILDRYENRVAITGSVFRPGSYALTEDLTVSQLIKRAEGLTGEAFLDRAILTRTLEDLTTEVISLDLRGILNGQTEDVILSREDQLSILSIHDLQTERFVKITGEVRLPGVFQFSAGMTLNDLVLLANGLNESASTGTIEVARRPAQQSRDKLTEIFNVSINSDLSISNSEFELRSYDHVIVRRNPDFYLERTVQIYGEVKFPGEYVLTSEGERISDLLKRAGGEEVAAYLEGATLLRKTEFFRSEEVTGESQFSTTEYDQVDGDFLNEFLDFDENSTPANLDVTTQAKQQRIEEIARNNPYLDNIEIQETETIALNMQAILDEPGSSADLILEEGDIINIPKELKTIRLRGRVLYPNAVRYEENKGLRHFIGKAGGFGSRAFKRRTYVVYANGEVSRTKGFMFFKSYPKPAPGAEVIIPVKPLKVPIKPTEFIGITSGLATIALLITQILQ